MATLKLTEQNFMETVEKNDMVVIDFWAQWCPPCRNFAPVFESVSEKYPNIVFAKLNTEEEQGLASHFQIRSIPTLMIFREQIIIFNQAGSLPAHHLEDVIHKAQALDMDQVREEIAKQPRE
jgi:thioredoxin